MREKWEEFDCFFFVSLSDSLCFFFAKIEISFL
jgi:hypothetical protein